MGIGSLVRNGDAGHRSVAFDLPSHNESDSCALAPGRTTATGCADVIAAMIETHGPADAVVAHSLGANATALAAGQGAPVGRLVFFASMADFPLYLDLFAARHGFGRLAHYRVLRHRPALSAGVEFIGDRADCRRAGCGPTRHRRAPFVACRRPVRP
ncbi:hypothetical protein MHEL_22830 [Mycolicibacterium helvum]|uniref:AB hydrolase-1 domain-containing protein n=1 Tax=Mycolicibacterium helvum TaxID=1534349 RepID=A0A7I7T4W8_9MYCO|nr:hypothetical protein MHEL_22830 [Mycolicibacterium helvum]